MAKNYPTRAGDIYVQPIINLAKDYTDKLRGYSDELAETLGSSLNPQSALGMTWLDYYKFARLHEDCQRLLPVTRDLAQAISQRIEHGPLEIFPKLEMRLVLAELETTIQVLERLMFSPKTQQNLSNLHAFL